MPTSMPSNPEFSFFVANTEDVDDSLISSPSLAIASHSSAHASAQYPSLPGAMRKHSLAHLARQNVVSAANAAGGAAMAAMNDTEDVAMMALVANARVFAHNACDRNARFAGAGRGALSARARALTRGDASVALVAHALVRMMTMEILC